MKLTNCNRALYEAKQSVARLLVQREKIDRKIARFQAVINDLQNLSTELLRKDREKSIDQVIKTHLTAGITDLSREILKEMHFPMTAGQVREKLEARKLDLSRYSNPLAVIHTVLKRLVKNGEVRVVPQERGKKAYQWISTTDKLLTELQRDDQSTVQHEGRRKSK